MGSMGGENGGASWVDAASVAAALVADAAVRLAAAAPVARTFTSGEAALVAQVASPASASFIPFD